MTQTSVAEIPAFLQDLDASYFQVACRQAAEIMSRPEYNGRLDKAVELVLNGAVTVHEDGTATVKSSSHTYHLEPECTCEDSQRRSLYCKHFLAVILLKRTLERLHQPVANGNSHQAHENGSEQAQDSNLAQTATSAWQCAQAPSSVTLKWNVGGIELMLTLRDETDDALFGRIQRVLPRIEQKMEAQRQAHQEAQANGKGQEHNHFCGLHGVPLRRNTKNGSVWYSHQTPDGQWCRGK